MALVWHVWGQTSCKSWPGATGAASWRQRQLDALAAQYWRWSIQGAGCWTRICRFRRFRRAFCTQDGCRCASSLVEQGLQSLLSAMKPADLVGFSFGGMVAGFIAEQCTL
jgi:hypothetical protein